MKNDDGLLDDFTEAMALLHRCERRIAREPIVSRTTLYLSPTFHRLVSDAFSKRFGSPVGRLDKLVGINLRTADEDAA